VLPVAPVAPVVLALPVVLLALPVVLLTLLVVLLTLLVVLLALLLASPASGASVASSVFSPASPSLLEHAAALPRVAPNTTIVWNSFVLRSLILRRYDPTSSQPTPTPLE